MVKAIFFDVDGTLLSYNSHQVAQSTIEAFARLKKEGVQLFLATGRCLLELNNLDELSFDGYLTVNGAYCVNENYELIHIDAIPRDDLEALIRYLDENEPFPFTLATPDENIVNYLDESVVSLYRFYNVPFPEVKGLREIDLAKVLQLCIYVDRQKEEDILQNILVNCQSNRWHPVFSDVTRRGVNKQTGIDRMLAYYGIDLRDTMAFGDGGNDIPMLQHVAIGIAMGNADDDVKNAAHYITDTIDNDGIWKALHHFLWK